MQYSGEFTGTTLWILIGTVFAIARRISKRPGHQTHRSPMKWSKSWKSPSVFQFRPRMPGLEKPPEKFVALDERIPIVRQIESIARHIRPIEGAWEPKGRKFIELFSRSES